MTRSETRRFGWLFVWGVGLLLTRSGLAAEPVDFALVAADFERAVRPLLATYCLDCHSSAEKAGDLDLERFAALEDVRRATGVWQKAAEFLDLGEMPPEDSPQPTPEERAAMRDWIKRFLHAEARARAGDPGPTLLRRLSNDEYTWTIRDLTGAPLDPARDFPADGAAGEGFTNASAALAMSPALLEKYIDAAKRLAQHAVLLPDGFRFSTSTTRSDWTNELVERIRDVYRRHAEAAGATQVNLQGIVFDTNAGGRLPLVPVLRAALLEREALLAGTITPEAAAVKHGVNAKYFRLLWGMLAPSDETARRESLLLDSLRLRARSAAPDDAPAIAAEIIQWQAALQRFQNVGHMKPWVVPVNPLQDLVELRLPLAPSAEGGDVRVLLTVGDAGDGAEGDLVELAAPRLTAPGRPDLPLVDLRDDVLDAADARGRLVAQAARALEACADPSAGPGDEAIARLAREFQVDEDVLRAWRSLALPSETPGPVLSLLTGKQSAVAGYEFIRGWGPTQGDLPNVLANSSDQQVRVPGVMKPHAVCVHPTPELSVGVGWTSPLDGAVRIEGQVLHVHPECGNGVVWALELRRGGTRQRLGGGVAHGSTPQPVGPFSAVAVRRGDLLSLLIGPRDANHACDLTDVELLITCSGEGGATWRLKDDVSPDIHQSNPHADRSGQPGVWSFYSEPAAGGSDDVAVPAGSLLARWQGSANVAERRTLGQALQALLEAPAPAEAALPDAVLRRELLSINGPLLRQARSAPRTSSDDGAADRVNRREAPGVALPGLDRALFGRRPDGSPIDPQYLSLPAGAAQEFLIPAELAEGATLAAAARIDAAGGGQGSVQVRLWAGDSNRPTTLSPDAPVLVAAEPVRRRFEQSFDDFRDLFPAALCYPKIVPVDEVITLTLFHREDEPLVRLMLEEQEARELDRLWTELRFVSEDALTTVDAFAQLLEYASQDSDPGLFEPLRGAIMARAEAHRQARLDAEPVHLRALSEFAAIAFRRPLSPEEQQGLGELYARLRHEGLPHDEAFRLTLARVFMAPEFLYRPESPSAGIEPGPLNDWELATRLSYWLWASTPDAELRAEAAAGRLHEPDVLAAQARRMLHDPKVRRLAVGFGCQWLQIYEFDQHDEKSERLFPEFALLKGDMYEEAIQFFTHAFQSNAPVRDLFDADYVYVNERLAGHYGLAGNDAPKSSVVNVADEEWRRVDGVRAQRRGGVLGLAAVLSKQSGASRTSPILRGAWLSEVLLGEKLPRPPKGVPQLPTEETDTEGLTVRQLVERHSSDARCARCHARVDPFGFALEEFDAIGRWRTTDLAGRALDVQTVAADGHPLAGFAGLKSYLLEVRRPALHRQFARKLLGHALGRGVQLSDEPLLDAIGERLEHEDARLGDVVEAIVRSPQFRQIRGRDADWSDVPEAEHASE